MSENEKKVPKRRFKEFENAEGWEQHKFSELFTTLQNNALSRAELNSEHGVAMNVHYGDVLIKFGELLDVSKEEIPFIIDDTCVSKYQSSFLKNGDVIIADAAEDETVGKCSEIIGLTTQTVISGLHTIPCRPVQVFASGYLGFYMNSNAYHNQLLPLIQGTKVSSISKSALNDTVLRYPKSNEEQTLIAKYFIRMDNLITLHQRKLDKMKALKKAYLTDMFPAEGERKPKLRFDGFTDDWEQCRLSDVAIFIDGNYGEKYPKDNEFIENGVPFFTSAVIGTSGVFDKKNVKYISKEKNSVLVKAQSLGGDIILTNRGASMGVVAQIPLEYGLVNIGPQLTRIRGTEKADNLFLLSMFKNPSYNQKLLSINSGSAMNFVGLESLGKFEFMCPKLDEQAQIGVFFKNIDNLITLHQNKIEKLQNIKKAYLNEMFI